MGQGYIKHYECVKSFEVPQCDDNGLVLEEEEPIVIKAGSKWEIIFYSGQPDWLAHRIDGVGRLFDLPKEAWDDKEHFALYEAYPYGQV